MQPQQGKPSNPNKMNLSLVICNELRLITSVLHVQKNKTFLNFMKNKSQNQVHCVFPVCVLNQFARGFEILIDQACPL